MTRPQLVGCAAAWALVGLAGAVIAGVPGYRVATIAVQAGIWLGIVVIAVLAIREEDRAHNQRPRNRRPS